MYIEIWHLVFFGLILLLAIGIIFKFIFKPLIISNHKEKLKVQYDEVLKFKREQSAIKGADAAFDKRNIDRRQNIAVLKIQGYIAKYNKWKKPVRTARVLTSFVTGLIATVLIAYFMKEKIPLQPIDFSVLAIFLFFFSYLFWGNSMEAAWKSDIEGKMHQEFDNAIELSSNPIEMKEKLSEWMKGHKDINDDMKKSIEDLLDKWLKKHLKME